MPPAEFEPAIPASERPQTQTTGSPCKNMRLANADQQIHSFTHSPIPRTFVTITVNHVARFLATAVRLQLLHLVAS
jgi:hypothetical protein